MREAEIVLLKHPQAKMCEKRSYGGNRSYCVQVPGFDEMAQGRLVRSFTVWRMSEDAAWKEAAERVQLEVHGDGTG